MKVALAIAILAAFVHLLAEAALGPWAPFVKMAPVGILGLLVLGVARTGLQKLAAFGLLLGSLADAVIEWSFLAGLAVFLVAHLMYIAAFVGIERRPHWSRLVLVTIWAAAAMPVLVGHAEGLAGPVALYGLVIFTMIWRAGAAVETLAWNSRTLGFLGALFFGVSDTLLGFSRFVAPLPASDFLIMGTYWTGQGLIAVSFLWAGGRS